MQQYSVMLKHQNVGKACVTRQGLYYRFHCRCRLPGEGICRLLVTSPGGQKNLGVLIPCEDGFGLETRLPVKEIGEGELSFQIIPEKGKPSGTFVPIRDEEPFAYITSLKSAFLVRKGEEIGIQIEKMQEH